MSTIAVCEGDPRQLVRLTEELKENFSNYEVVAAQSARGLLIALTGVDLQAVRPISLEGVISALKGQNATFPGLQLVITDDKLIDSSAGAGDMIFGGWDLVTILRKVGYTGKSVYIGMSAPPASMKVDAQIEKSDLSGIVNYARQVLI